MINTTPPFFDDRDSRLLLGQQRMLSTLQTTQYLKNANGGLRPIPPPTPVDTVTLCGNQDHAFSYI